MVWLPHRKPLGSTKRHIGKSQREVTVLFTDIENSARFWGSRGDVQGRLMVDRHNRILFPVIKHYRGRVVKTIGDSILALFRRPEDATNAAIAMQQTLKAARKEDKAFRIKIRIGVHTGEAIVEHNDVFGDTVNIASRIEHQGQGNQILLSGKCAKELDKRAFNLIRREGFVPKGKAGKIAVFECNWEQHKDLIHGITRRNLIPLSARQKWEVSLYGLIAISGLYLIHLRYTRFLLSDNEKLALMFLNPQQQLMEHPLIVAVSVMALVTLFWVLMRINTIPESGFKLLKGLAVGGLLYAGSYAGLAALPAKTVPRAEETLYQSHHLFVEVRADDALIREAPSPQAQPISRQPKETLLLLADVKQVGNVVWNKVLLGNNSYGWVPRILPARVGAPETRVSFAEKFYFHRSDLYALWAALAGFLWGFISFRAKPV